MRHFVLAVALSLLVVPAAAAEPVGPTGSFVMRLAQAEGTTLVFLGQRDGRELTLSAKTLGGATHRLSTMPTVPDTFYVGSEGVAAAYDTRRRRFLVAWVGWQPGMADKPCPDTSKQPPFLPADPSCRLQDEEIFGRLVARDGRPLAPIRRLSATGPATSTRHRAVAPTLAFDRRRDRFVLAHATTTPDFMRAGLAASVVDGAGRRTGPTRALRPLRRPTAAPVPRLVGSTLLFLWGDRVDRRAVHAVRLDGHLRAGTARRLSPRRALFEDVAASPRSALVVWSTPKGRAARRVDLRGRRDGDVVRLPFGLVPVRVSTSASGRWRYAYAIDRSVALRSDRQLMLREASAGGRPLGEPVPVTAGGEEADLSALVPGVIAWNVRADHASTPHAAAR